MMLLGVSIFLAILISGSILYCGLAVLASLRYRRRRPEPSREMPFISVLKPLSGAEEGLRENLRSFFEQDYPEFEVLLAVADAEDAAIPVAREIMAEYPVTHSSLIVTGDEGNRLGAMAAESRYDLLVIAESDVRVNPDLLRVLAAEMAGPAVQAVACPYRASAGISIWSALEAIGMNTEFLAGLLVNQLRGSVDFPLGCTFAIRREALNAAGNRVLLSNFIVERRLGAQHFRANFAQRVMRARGRRRSGLWDYLGEILGKPIPLAVLLVLCAHAFWLLFAMALLIRFWAAYATSQKILHDPLTRDFWYLIPIQDTLSFIVWIGGFWIKS